MTTISNKWGAEAFEAARRENRKATRLTMHPMDYTPAYLPDPARTLIEIKMDGIGLIWGFNGLGPLTNEGHEMPCAAHLNAGLNEMQERMGGRWIFHGEYFAGSFEGTLASFKSGAHTGAVWLHDAVPLDVWEGRSISAPLYLRRALLESAIEGLHSKGIYLMRQASGHFDEEAVEDAAGTVWGDGEEGIIIKDADSPYVRQSSPFWMRLKRTGTVDLAIQAVNIGDVGVKSIVVIHEGVAVSVPIQKPDLKRKAYEFRTGRIVEIKHQGVTAKGSLRSAQFSRFRDDKGE